MITSFFRNVRVKIAAPRLRNSFHRNNANRSASTYEGDGKTHAQMINKETDVVMVNGVSTIGVLLNSGIRVIGPCVIFARTVLSWNISGLEEVNEKSLRLFSIMHPRIDILVFGYGDAGKLPSTTATALRSFSNKFNIGLELLPTDKAATTFNFLVHEKRFVAGAFFPHTEIELYRDVDRQTRENRRQLLEAEEKPE